MPILNPSTIFLWNYKLFLYFNCVQTIQYCFSKLFHGFRRNGFCGDLLSYEMYAMVWCLGCFGETQMVAHFQGL